MNELKKIRKINNAMQAGLSDRLSRTVDNMLTEMDAARMGAVDREVVRRDLMTMVLERESMGTQLPEELDGDTREMCRQIEAEIGCASRLERQLYWVMWIVTISTFMTGLSFGSASLANNGMLMPVPLTSMMVFEVLATIFFVYKGFRGSEVFKRSRTPVPPAWIFCVYMSIAVVTTLVFNLYRIVYGQTIMILPCYIFAVQLICVAASTYSYNKFMNEQALKYNLS